MAKVKAKVIARSIQLVIAGPGAGKTHQMVERIVAKLPALNPHRCMAVITYTNAATQMIQERLQKRCSVPGNVFIGTIHSFLNRFILMPHGRLAELLPKDVKFIDNVTISPGRATSKDRTKQIFAELAIKKNAREKGFVTYGDIEALAHKLLTNKKANPNRILARQAIANRLEYIFVDEYQDATDIQHRILLELLKDGATTVYCVGDPEQYIYGFTYRDRHRAAPDFENLPIMQTAALPELPPTKIIENRRSTLRIVGFLNCLNTQIQQVVGGDLGERDRNHPIRLLPETNTKELCARFDAEVLKLGFEERHQQLILATDNRLVDQISVDAKCGRISNDQMSSRSLLAEALRFMAGVLGHSQREIRGTQNLSILAWRAMGFKFLGRLKQEVNPQLDGAKKLAEEVTGIPAEGHAGFEPNMKDSLGKIVGWVFGTIKSNKACSTIHKAKGLEADAVLVIADSRKELRKWLETDQAKRFADKKDECRVGFVAFSRAKLFLAIGCLEPLSDELSGRIASMGIECV